MGNKQFVTNIYTQLTNGNVSSYVASSKQILDTYSGESQYEFNKKQIEHVMEYVNNDVYALYIKPSAYFLHAGDESILTCNIKFLSDWGEIIDKTDEVEKWSITRISPNKEADDLWNEQKSHETITSVITIKSSDIEGDSTLFTITADFATGRSLSNNVNLQHYLAGETFIFDIDNYMDAAPTDKEYVVTYDVSLYTKASLTYGDDRVVPDEIMLEYRGLPEGCASIDNNYDFNITVVLTAGMEIEPNNVLIITASGIYNDIPYTKQAMFNVYADIDGIIHQLAPSANKIQLSATGVYTPTSIYCRILKKTIDGISYSNDCSIGMVVDGGEEMYVTPDDVIPLFGKNAIAPTEGVIYNLYEDGLLSDTEYIPVITDGVTGESTIKLDLDNEMDSIPVDSEYRALEDYDVKTTATMYYGNEYMIISDSIATYAEAMLENEEETEESPYLDNIIITKVFSNDGKHLDINIHVQVGAKVPKRFLVEVNTLGLYGDKVADPDNFRQDEQCAYMSIVAIPASESTPLYYIKTNANAIKVDKTNARQPINIGLTVYARTSLTDYHVSDDYGYVMYAKDDDSSVLYTRPIDTEDVGKYIIFQYFDPSDNLLDQETVPVIFDGRDGSVCRSIKDIDEYYLATTSEFEVPGYDEDWFENEYPGDEFFNEENPWLWNYEKITYVNYGTDASIFRSTPTILAKYTKGIIGVEEYYLVTDIQSGIDAVYDKKTKQYIVSSGYNNLVWQQYTIPEMSEEDPYLWNFEKILYDNGTFQITDPAIIGVHGTDTFFIDIDNQADIVAVDEDHKTIPSNSMYYGIVDYYDDEYWVKADPLNGIEAVGPEHTIVLTTSFSVYHNNSRAEVCGLGFICSDSSNFKVITPYVPKSVYNIDVDNPQNIGDSDFNNEVIGRVTHPYNPTTAIKAQTDTNGPINITDSAGQQWKGMSWVEGYIVGYIDSLENIHYDLSEPAEEGEESPHMDVAGILIYSAKKTCKNKSKYNTEKNVIPVYFFDKPEREEPIINTSTLDSSTDIFIDSRGDDLKALFDLNEHRDIMYCHVMFLGYLTQQKYTDVMYYISDEIDDLYGSNDFSVITMHIAVRPGVYIEDHNWIKIVADVYMNGKTYRTSALMTIEASRPGKATRVYQLQTTYAQLVQRANGFLIPYDEADIGCVVFKRIGNDRGEYITFEELSESNVYLRYSFNSGDWIYVLQDAEQYQTLVDNAERTIRLAAPIDGDYGRYTAPFGEYPMWKMGHLFEQFKIENDTIQFSQLSFQLIEIDEDPDEEEGETIEDILAINPDFHQIDIASIPVVYGGDDTLIFTLDNAMDEVPMTGRGYVKEETMLETKGFLHYRNEDVHFIDEDVRNEMTMTSVGPIYIDPTDASTLDQYNEGREYARTHPGTENPVKVFYDFDAVYDDGPEYEELDPKPIKYIELTFYVQKNAQFPLDKHNVKVTGFAIINGELMQRSAVFTIQGKRGGELTLKYRIIPTSPSIERDLTPLDSIMRIDGRTLHNPETIDCYVISQYGNEPADILEYTEIRDNFRIGYTIDFANNTHIEGYDAAVFHPADADDYPHIYSYTITEQITFYLYAIEDAETNALSLVDSQTVYVTDAEIEAGANLVYGTQSGMHWSGGEDDFCYKINDEYGRDDFRLISIAGKSSYLSSPYFEMQPLKEFNVSCEVLILDKDTGEITDRDLSEFAGTLTLTMYNGNTALTSQADTTTPSIQLNATDTVNPDIYKTWTRVKFAPYSATVIQNYSYDMHFTIAYAGPVDTAVRIRKIKCEYGDIATTWCLSKLDKQGLTFVDIQEWYFVTADANVIPQFWTYDTLDDRIVPEGQYHSTAYIDENEHRWTWYCGTSLAAIQGTYKAEYGIDFTENTVNPYTYIWNVEVCYDQFNNVMSVTPVACLATNGFTIKRVDEYYCVSEYENNIQTLGEDPTNAAGWILLNAEYPGEQDVVEHFILTEERAYLWNYEVVHFTNGTSEETSPLVVNKYDFGLCCDVTNQMDIIRVNEHYMYTEAVDTTLSTDAYLFHNGSKLPLNVTNIAANACTVFGEPITATGDNWQALENDDEVDLEVEARIVDADSDSTYETLQVRAIVRANLDNPRVFNHGPHIDIPIILRSARPGVSNSNYVGGTQFTIGIIRGGESCDIYQLHPSGDFVLWTKDGGTFIDGVAATTLTCQIAKKRSNITTICDVEDLLDAVILKVSYNGGGKTVCQSTNATSVNVTQAVNSSLRQVMYYLYDKNDPTLLLDVETIPVVVDGIDGNKIIELQEWYFATNDKSVTPTFDAVTRVTTSTYTSTDSVTGTTYTWYKDSVKDTGYSTEKRFLWNVEVLYSTDNNEFHKTNPALIASTGLSIKKIREWYLVTDIGQGVVTDPDPIIHGYSWVEGNSLSEDTFRLTLSKQFLWNYEEIVYTFDSVDNILNGGSTVSSITEFSEKTDPIIVDQLMTGVIIDLNNEMDAIIVDADNVMLSANDVTMVTDLWVDYHSTTCEISKINILVGQTAVEIWPNPSSSPVTNNAFAGFEISCSEIGSSEVYRISVTAKAGQQLLGKAASRYGFTFQAEATLPNTAGGTSFKVSSVFIVELISDIGDGLIYQLSPSVDKIRVTTSSVDNSKTITYINSSGQTQVTSDQITLSCSVIGKGADATSNIIPFNTLGEHCLIYYALNGGQWTSYDGGNITLSITSNIKEVAFKLVDKKANGTAGTLLDMENITIAYDGIDGVDVAYLVCSPSVFQFRLSNTEHRIIVSDMYQASAPNIPSGTIKMFVSDEQLTITSYTMTRIHNNSPVTPVIQKNQAVNTQYLKLFLDGQDTTQQNKGNIVGDTFIQNDGLSVEVYGTDSDGQTYIATVAISFVYTINGAVNGNFVCTPSVSMIHVDNDYNLTETASVEVLVEAYVDDALIAFQFDQNVLPSGYTVSSARYPSKYVRKGYTIGSPYTDIVGADMKTQVKLTGTGYNNNGELVQLTGTFEISLLIDGEGGGGGEQGIMRTRGWWKPNTEYYNNSMFDDVIQQYYNGTMTYYMKKYYGSHTSAASWAADAGEWEQCTKNVEVIAASMLVSSNGYIEIMGSSRVYVYDDDTYTTGWDISAGAIQHKDGQNDLTLTSAGTISATNKLKFTVGGVGGSNENLLPNAYFNDVDDIVSMNSHSMSVNSSTSVYYGSGSLQLSPQTTSDTSTSFVLYNKYHSNVKLQANTQYTLTVYAAGQNADTTVDYYYTSPNSTAYTKLGNFSLQTNSSVGELVPVSHTFTSPSNIDGFDFSFKAKKHTGGSLTTYVLIDAIKLEQGSEFTRMSENKDVTKSIYYQGICDDLVASGFDIEQGTISITGNLITFASNQLIINDTGNVQVAGDFRTGVSYITDINDPKYEYYDPTVDASLLIMANSGAIVPRVHYMNIGVAASSSQYAKQALVSNYENIIMEIKSSEWSLYEMDCSTFNDISREFLSSDRDIVILPSWPKNGNNYATQSDDYYWRNNEIKYVINGVYTGSSFPSGSIHVAENPSGGTNERCVYIEDKNDVNMLFIGDASILNNAFAGNAEYDSPSSLSDYLGKVYFNLFQLTDSNFILYENDGGFISSKATNVNFKVFPFVIFDTTGKIYAMLNFKMLKSNGRYEFLDISDYYSLVNKKFDIMDARLVQVNPTNPNQSSNDSNIYTISSGSNGPFGGVCTWQSKQLNNETQDSSTHPIRILGAGYNVMQNVTYMLETQSFYCNGTSTELIGIVPHINATSNHFFDNESIARSFFYE